MVKDLASGIGMLALSLVVYFGASGIGTSYMADPIGPAGLPKLLALVLGILSLLLIAKSALDLIKARRRAPVDSSETKWRRHFLAAGMLAIGGAYVLLAEVVGYGVGITLVILATALYQGAARSWRAPVIALGGAISFWLLFVVVLDIGQPEGLWSRLLTSLGV
jgi:putative tricarboxylic transport membrane protein